MIINRILLSIISVCLVLNMQAQSLFFDFNMGYSVGLMKSPVETFVNTTIEDDVYKIQNKKFSLGDGVSANISLTYFFTDNFGVDLAGRYFKSNLDSFVENTEIGTVISTKTKVLQASSFSVIPSFAFKNKWEKIEVGGNLGISVDAIFQKLDEITRIDGNVLTYKWKYHGKATFGIYSKLYLSYAMNESNFIGLDFVIHQIDFNPYSAEMYYINYNDRNLNINTLEPIENSIEFQDWVFDQYSQNPDPSKPLQLPKQTFSYGSIYFGVHFKHSIF